MPQTYPGCLQVYSALLHSTVKCNESELAVEVFRQMQLEGLPIDRSVYNLMVDVFVKMGTCEVSLQAPAQLPAAGQSSPSLMALEPARQWCRHRACCKGAGAGPFAACKNTRGCSFSLAAACCWQQFCPAAAAWARAEMFLCCTLPDI